MNLNKLSNIRFQPGNLILMTFKVILNQNILNN